MATEKRRRRGRGTICSGMGRAAKEGFTMAKKDDRFVVVHKEGNSLANSGYRQLLVDKQTGVTYLSIHCGYGAGLTPLLNADGRPFITRLDSLGEPD